MPERLNIYGDVDPRDLPVYSVGEVAHHLGLPARTVASWVLGQRYPTHSGERRSKPLVEIADTKNRMLSFNNLAELHVLSAVRRFHKLKMRPIRRAVEYLRKELHSRHPLIDRKMETDGKGLFIDYYGKLLNISEGGQAGLRVMLEQFLKRIDWDEKELPVRLYPLVGQKADDGARRILIDPRIRFGQPCLTGTRIPTSVIAERRKAGDSVEELAEDYGRSPVEITAALRYERVAAA